MRKFLRACLKRSPVCQASDHQASHGKVDHGLAALWKRFIVLGQAATLGNPGEGSFHHPAPGQDDKALLSVATEHWLQTETTMQKNPFKQETTIGAINPDASHLFAGTWQTCEQPPGAFRIGHARCGDDDSQQQTHRIDQDVALAAFDLLASIVAAYTRPWCGLDALAIQCSSRRVLMAASLAANLSTKGVMNALPCPIIAKPLKGGRHALPARIVLGQHARTHILSPSDRGSRL